MAQRQYDAVDPDNRLVAGELERRWEEKLRQHRQTEEAYHHFLQTPLPDSVPLHLRDLFQDVSGKLPELWPMLCNEQKKELLRSLIRAVIITRPVPDQIELRIVWISGNYSDTTVLTAIYQDEDVTGYDRMVARIHELWQQGDNDEEMAQQLTYAGFHSARSASVARETVQKIRLQHQWYTATHRLRTVEQVEGHWTTRGLAKQLAVDSSTICRYIYAGVIPPEYVTHHPQAGTYLIHQDAQLLQQLRERIAVQKRRNGMVKSVAGEET